MKRLAAPSALLAALTLAPGCALLDRESHVSIASDPPGARVVINQRDSGFVTPCLLSLETGETQRIDLEYPGYVTATRVLTPDNRVYAILWSDMYTRSEAWHFPLWLNFRDLLVPVKFDRTHAPSRLYVKLDRGADS